MNETALQHWGIKGMKWGVRRYQNKDGTLTALGRKREREMNDKLNSANKELKALRAENASLKKQTTTNSRRVSELSDDELRQRINRLNMEKQYADIYNQVHPNRPHPGKAFAQKILNDSIIPAAVNVGKSTLEKSLKKAFGLEDKPDQGKALDLAMKKLDYGIKQVDYESKKFDLDKKKNSNSNNDESTDKKKDTKSNNDESTDKKKDTKSNTDKTVYEDPEVIFDSNYKKKGGGYRGEKWEKRSNSDTIYDAEWTDITPSEAKSTDVAVYGKSFVNALLENRHD